MRSVFNKILWSSAAAFLLTSGAAARAQGLGEAPFLEGKLVSVIGTGPVLKANGRNYTLSGKTPYLFHTLQDERLRNREVRLDGAMKPDGSFQVERIFTVRNGKIYRIRYFCETCNIEALEPGNCVCCQQPTELQEIPVDKNDKHIIVAK